MSKTFDRSAMLNLLNRRRFLRKSGLVGAAALGSRFIQPGAAKAAPLVYADPKRHTATVNDILNFALNLEYLEAEFYLRAVTGTGLADTEITGVGGSVAGKRSNQQTTPGAVTGGTQVPFTDPTVKSIANDIANDEHNHVLFLRDALGRFAVARPTIDLSASFTNAAIAAGIIASGQTFNPFTDDDSFLLGAFIFEDVGVTAYHGAAASIGDGAVLQAAAGILAVEAYHGGAIHALLASRGVTAPADITDANAISTLRATADGSAGGHESPLVTTTGQVDIAPSDGNSIAFARTLDEVLAIVYLGAAPGTGGGFFPNRLNGAIQ